MSNSIFEKSFQDNFTNRSAEDQLKFLKSHWIHKDGHISDKSAVGKLLNKWFVTRLAFRKICGIGLNGTIDRLKNHKNQANDSDKQTQFNSTCDFLISMIEKISSKRNNKYIEEIKKLKFNIITIHSLPQEKLDEIEAKAKEIKTTDLSHEVQQKLNEIFDTFQPEQQQIVMDHIISVVNPEVADHIRDVLPKEQKVPSAETAKKVSKLPQVGIAASSQEDETINPKPDGKPVSPKPIDETAKPIPGTENVNSKSKDEAAKAKPVAETVSYELEDEDDDMAESYSAFLGSDPNYVKAESILTSIRKVRPDEQANDIAQAIRDGSLEVARYLFSTRIDQDYSDIYEDEIDAAKVLGLIENPNPKALQAVLQEEYAKVVLRDGISYLKRQNVEEGDRVAEIVKAAYEKLFPADTSKMDDFKEALYLRGEEGYAAAHMRHIFTSTEETQFEREIGEALKSQTEENQLARLEKMAKYAKFENPYLLLSRSFTKNPQAELIQKLIGLYQNNNEHELSIGVRKLKKEDQHRVIEALKILTTEDPDLAKKIAAKIFSLQPGKLDYELYKFCLELSPPAEQPFAIKIREMQHKSARSIMAAIEKEGSSLTRLGFMLQAFSVISPEQAPDLMTRASSHDDGVSGYAILGLYQNKPAFKAVLNNPKSRKKLLDELRYVYRFQEPLNRLILEEVFAELDHIGQLKDSLKSMDYLSLNVSKLPVGLQEIVLKHLEGSKKLPSVVAAIIHETSNPKWHEEETLRVMRNTVFHSYIEDKFSRPIDFNHIKGKPYQEPQTQQSLGHIKTPEQARELIMEMGRLLDYRFNAFNSVGYAVCHLSPAESYSEKADKIEVTKALQQKKFLSEEFSQVVNDEFKEGFVKLADHYCSLLDQLPVEIDRNKLAEEIKNYCYHQSVVLYLFLLIKMDPTQYEIAVKAAHDHDFCLLFSQMSEAQGKEVVKKRLELFKDNPERFEEFKKVFLSFIPVTQISSRRNWAKFIDENRV